MSEHGQLACDGPETTAHASRRQSAGGTVLWRQSSEISDRGLRRCCGVLRYCRRALGGICRIRVAYCRKRLFTTKYSGGRCRRNSVHGRSRKRSRSGAAALSMAQLGQMALALGAGPAQQLLVQAVAIVAATSVRRVPFKLLPLKRKPRTKERSSKDNLSDAVNLMR
jgi:hypothetical protein